MGPRSPHEGRNRLVEALPRRQQSSFMERSRFVDLEYGDILCEPDQPFHHVYFPLGGYVSMRRLVDGGRPLEVALIGNEGMVGATLVLGVNAANLRGIVNRAGPALRMSAGRFKGLLRRSPALSRGIGAYLHLRVDQLSQTAGCIHYHEISERLARWLLMTHDRADTNVMQLTHQTLADILGVQRSAVTIAAGELRRNGVIGYARGTITVRDRLALEAASCGCYVSTGRH